MQNYSVVGGYWNYGPQFGAMQIGNGVVDVFVSCVRDREDLEGIKLFLENNPLEINKRFREGFLEGTLLLFSILYGRKCIIHYLLSHKDIDEEATFYDEYKLKYHNKRAIEVARLSNYTEIVQLLAAKEQAREQERSQTNPTTPPYTIPQGTNRTDPLQTGTNETIPQERKDQIPQERPTVQERNEITPQGRSTVQERNEITPQERSTVQERNEITPQERPTVQERNDIIPQERPTEQERNNIIPPDRNDDQRSKEVEYQRERDQPPKLDQETRNQPIQPRPQKEQTTKRFISPEEPTEGDQPLAPLILLRKNDPPQPLSLAIEKAMGEDMDEIFYQGHLPYIQEKFRKTPEEKKHNLTYEEFCAVYFYTAQWDDKHLYSLLNASLTAKERSSKLPQWRHYLHYLLSALQKLPKWQGTQDLYRGVSLDLAGQYPEKYKKGEVITWYAFSSTTTNMEVVKAFLPEEKPSTIFTINGAFSGRCIQDYSVYQTESEILLPAGSRFEIVAVTKFGSVTIVQMKQVATLEKLLKLED